MVKVLIVDNMVHEILGTEAPEVHESLLVVDAPDDIQEGDLYDGTSFSKPNMMVTIEEVREWRNQKLAESDWTAGTDVPQIIKDNWESYRQALRDFPATFVPFERGQGIHIEWPTKPE